MIKHKKIVASLALVSVLLNTAVFAQNTASFAENYGSDIVRISGESEMSDILVSCTVYKEELSAKKLYELTDEEKDEVYANQKTADANAYSFDFTPRGGSGRYVYYVNFYKSETPVTGKFLYVTQSDRAAILELANDETKTGEDIKNEIKNGFYGKFAQVSNTFSELDDAAMLKVGEAIAAAETYQTYDEVIADINYYSVVSSFLKDFDVQKLKDNSEFIFGEDLTEYKIFEKEDSEFAGKTIARLKDAKSENFVAEFAKAVYLTQIECAGNVSQISDIMTSIKNRTDIKVDNYFELKSTSELDSELIGNSYTADRLEKIIAGADDEESESTGSSGKKNTGSSGGSIVTATITQPQSSVTGPDVAPKADFEDLSTSHWAYEMVNVLVENGIVSGDGNGRFNPENGITREEFTKLVVAAFGLESSTAVSNFEDVATDRWSYKYISSAYSMGIVSGKGASVFEPGSNITREEAAHMLCNVIDAKSYVATKSREYAGFNDETDISAYALSDVKLLYCAGIINGYEDNTFGAKNSITRAEGAAMIYNMLKNIR